MAQQTPNHPWWQNALANFAAPVALVSLISAAVSVYAAIDASREHARAYEQTFENLLDKQVVANRIFLPEGGLPDEQKAAATLLALQGLAETEAQRETVLLFAARIIAVNPKPETGGPSARVLTLLIQQIDDDLRANRDRAANQRLRDVSRSRAFLDLVTAGISDEYYNDDVAHPARREAWPTLNGDQPLSTEAIRDLLFEIGPEQDRIDGWVHLATFGTDYRYAKQTNEQAVEAAGALRRETARNFINSTIAVASGDLTHARDIRYQYAIEAPAAKAGRVQIVLIGPHTWTSRIPTGVLMLKARLLRDRPPVVYVNPDGTFRKGSLGKVLGAVPAATCVDIVEPVRNVLVFVDSKYVEGEGLPSHWYGLIHLWAHVRSSQDGCAFPSPVP